ncbi:type IV pilus biogenesis/stability protein PilW [Chromobacterium sp. Beijing]|uniref:type IV pilus biogenesis/stability protein PilW n=1 Tax=Chromobacterium sp. Beijing TaxID=2735795 RepID=UPI001F1C7C8B|nr:type IV pilus biogenesis/stability protein PilW [Chromobacterium sp. Beijing]
MTIRQMGLMACLWMAVSSTAFAADPETSRELATIRSQLAIEYAKIGNYKVALETADLAVAADPAYVPAYVSRAYVLTQLREEGPAEANYRKALQLDPNNPEANNNYGLFLCDRNRLQDSLSYFQKALANPLYDSPQTAYLNLGHCSAKAGNQEQANDYLLAALRAAPNFAPALRELAQLHLGLGNAKLAAFYFERMGKGAALQADDLWLGVQIGRKSGNRTLESECSVALKNRYPDSKETQLLLSGS